MILSFGLADDAFAISAGDEYTPTQPNALASYSNSTNQVQVSWNFTTNTAGQTTGAPETCLLKGDIVWYDDLNDDPLNSVSGVDFDKVRGFIPFYYSVVSSSPTVIDTLSEVVPCEGSVRIDIDTIMSHSENINNYSDLEIFLSFYVANADGSFNQADASRIDEVFVMYTPIHVFDDAAYRVYGCGDETNNGIGNQIGSTLYIDASGSGGTVIAYGDNGDNCGDHLYLENDEYVDIGPIGSPSPGTANYGTHNELFPLLITVNYGGSDAVSCSDCIDPTFYYSQHKIIVKDGFVYNNYSTDVNATHTKTPPLITNVNQTNVMKLKVYDNFGTNAIEWIDVGFGIPSINHAFAASEATIEIRFSNNEITEIKISEQNLMDFGNITSDRVDCGYIVTTCLEVIIPHTFRDNFEYKMVVIRAIDQDDNEVYNYMNDGIEIHGESINEAPTDRVWLQKYLGNTQWEWLDIVRTDRVNDIWTFDDGLEFTSLGGGYKRMAPLGHNPNLID